VAHPHRRETRDLGLESIEGDALVIRVVMKTRTNAMDDVARELRMRLRDTMIGLDLTVPSMATVQLAGPKAPAASTVRTRRAPAPTPSRLHRFPSADSGEEEDRRGQAGHGHPAAAHQARSDDLLRAEEGREAQDPAVPAEPPPPLPEAQNPQDPQNPGDDR
jgi:small conductance mechanosensitive channel